MRILPIPFYHHFDTMGVIYAKRFYSTSMNPIFVPNSKIFLATVKLLNAESSHILTLFPILSTNSHSR